MRTCGLCLGQLPDITDPIRTREMCRCEPRVSIDHEHEAERLALARRFGVITDIRELSGWDIIELRRHKPGVVVYTARRQHAQRIEQRMGFAKDSIFAAVQLPP